MAKKPEALEGQIIAKEENLPSQDTEGGFGITNFFGFMIRGYAAEKSLEIEAQVEDANDRLLAARKRRMKSERKVRKQEEHLTPENIDRMVATVTNDVVAKLDNSEARREKAERDRERQAILSDSEDLKAKAEYKKLEEELLRTELATRKLKAKLNADEGSLEEKIAAAEAEKEKVKAEMATFKEAADSSGEKVDMDAARALANKLQSVHDQLAKLYDRKRIRDDEADE